MQESFHQERLRKFSEFLEGNIVIDAKHLRQYCFECGIPDDKTHYRSLTWKILLGYVSADKADWELALAEKRRLYHQFVSELIYNEQSSTQDGDHPLNPAPTSQWNRFFRDNDILSQIFKDVRRLYPDISFFQQKVTKTFANSSQDCDILGRTTATKAKSIDIVRDPFGTIETRSSDKKSKSSDDSEDDHFSMLLASDGEEFHWQIVARILFVYAKLNPGQSYVQGMNEIIGPIYYVFNSDSKTEWKVHSEADSFWCFTSLMSEIRDMYNSHADADQSTGVVSMMTKLTNLLLREDSQLYYHLYQNQGIKPHYYAFRWITLLLSQEFPLPEVLRIWDFLFADDNRFIFLIQVCCAMLMLLRDDLLNGDFASNMKLLQNFPDKIDVSTIISRAKKIKSL